VNRLQLKKAESVVLCCLWTLYADRIRSGSLSRAILVSITEIQFELEKYGVKDQIDKSAMTGILTLFSRFNLIEVNGKIGEKDCLVRLYPSLQFALDRFGYDLGWFAVLYLTGGYLKKYGIPRLNSFPKNIALYAGCTLGTFMLELLLLPLAGRLTGLTYYASVPFHYNALFVYLAAVGLFGAFAVLKVKEGRFADRVRFWSPAVFGVYLIHQQTDIAPRWFAWVNALTGRLGDFWNIVPGETGVTAGRMLLVLLVQSIIVFVVCIGIERLRLCVFDRIGKSCGRFAAK